MTWLGILLVFLHLTIKDQFSYLSTAYLVTPFPFLGLLFLPYALLKFSQGKRGLATLFGIIAFCIPIQHFFGHRIIRKQSKQGDPVTGGISFIFWTPDHYQFTTIDEAFLYLKSFDADVIALVEGNVDHGRQHASALKFFPDHKMKLLPHAMLLIYRGELVADSAHSFDNGNGLLSLCKISLNNKNLTLGIYDQASYLLLNRTPAIRELRDLISPFTDGNFILMGDFNTPHTSYSARQLNKNLRSAFSLFESNNPYTWPEFFPFVAIDQIWHSRSISIKRPMIQDTGLSHHRLLAFEIDFIGN